MIEIRSYRTTENSCRSQPFDRTLDNHTIFGGMTPIGHVWRDNPRLPWRYEPSGMMVDNPTTAYETWTIARCCEAVWVWRCDGWRKDILWRAQYGLLPDPALSRRIAHVVDFYVLTGETRSKTRKKEAFEQRSLALA